MMVARSSSQMESWTGTMLGHYRVERMLGAGGMGEVYEAEDLQLGRRVALKLLPQDVTADPERIRRFTIEVRALAALNHPGIVTVYAVDEARGRRFFTMELVEGKALNSLIVPGGLALERVLDLAVGLAEAVAAAHQHGIVHRDLKPANVMVTSDGRVKVLDFGLAKLRQVVESPIEATGPTLDATAAGTVLGTPAYMAPEQYRGLLVTERSDLFSLGVILYEMATGRQPFAGGSPASTMHAILLEEPAPVGTVRAGVPPELSGLIEHCLAKEPERRPASAAEVCDRLVRIRSAGAEPSRARAGSAAPGVAVLPLADMSPAGDQEYFCDGVAEEILNALAQVERLRVAARTSSFAFKGKLQDVREIGRRLCVDAVLEGSVRKAGERLRITVQLINVADGCHLWSERFDRGGDDIFAIQEEIAAGVAEKLKVALLGEERAALQRRHTGNPEAYHLYLKGRYFLNRRHAGDLQRAVEQFERASASDPDYALPYVGIADVFSVLGLWGMLPPAEAFGRVAAAARKALELDGSLGEAHFALASMLYLHEWQWEKAEEHFRRALEAPLANGVGHAWFAMYLVLRGRWEEARAMTRRAVELEPLSPITHTAAAAAHCGMGDVDGAVELLEKGLELDPGMPVALTWLAYCRIVQGRLGEAVELSRAATDAGASGAVAYLATALERRGDRDGLRELRARLDSLGEPLRVSPMWRAIVAAAWGDKEGCATLLERAEAEREPTFTLSAGCPGYRVGLPPLVQEWFAARGFDFTGSTAAGPAAGTSPGGGVP
jgi:TolB-like protein/Tfp pilus assembly protein PilF/predicted Ser/Thr protein kinase